MSDNGKMNPEWKAKWLEALRSGEYEQAQGALKTADGEFCCLGVLTDLCLKEGVVRGSWEDLPALFSQSGEYHDAVVTPLSAKAATGLPDSNPSVVYGGVAETLAELNDGGEEWENSRGERVGARAPLTFAEIADIIEEHL